MRARVCVRVCVRAHVCVSVHLLGGVSEKQRGGGAPLSVGVVMWCGGAVAGTGGGWLT